MKTDVATRHDRSRLKTCGVGGGETGNYASNSTLGGRGANMRQQMMPFLLISLAVLYSSCLVSRAQTIDGAASTPTGRQAGAEGKKEELSLKERSIARARAMFPEVKRRFLAGLPDGYTLFVEAESKGGGDSAFIAVDEMESGQIRGHWPRSMQAATSEISERAYVLSEEDLTDWIIVRPDGVTEGNFQSRLFGPLKATLATDVRSATGATCSEARLALESLTRSEAVRICAAHDSAQLCGKGEGVWPLPCQWDEKLRLSSVTQSRRALLGCEGCWCWRSTKPKGRLVGASAEVGH
jgi:hypothetical protein